LLVSLFFCFGCYYPGRRAIAEPITRHAAPVLGHGIAEMASRLLTILTGRNLPTIIQQPRPEPSTINEKTLADFMRVVEQTVLACFRPQWPKLKRALAYFELQQPLRPSRHAHFCTFLGNESPPQA
jgi:hypothetical protein